MAKVWSLHVNVVPARTVCVFKIQQQTTKSSQRYELSSPLADTTISIAYAACGTRSAPKATLLLTIRFSILLLVLPPHTAHPWPFSASNGRVARRALPRLSPDSPHRVRRLDCGGHWRILDPAASYRLKEEGDHPWRFSLKAVSCSRAIFADGKTASWTSSRSRSSCVSSAL